MWLQEAKNEKEMGPGYSLSVGCQQDFIASHWRGRSAWGKVALRS